MIGTRKNKAPFSINLWSRVIRSQCSFELKIIHSNITTRVVLKVVLKKGFHCRLIRWDFSERVGIPPCDCAWLLYYHICGLTIWHDSWQCDFETYSEIKIRRKISENLFHSCLSIAYFVLEIKKHEWNHKNFAPHN